MNSISADTWAGMQHKIKESVGYKCENCKRYCRRDDQSWEEFFENQPVSVTNFSVAVELMQRFTLIISHIDHAPENCHLFKLIILCLPCYLRNEIGQEVLQKKQLKDESVQFNLSNESIEPIKSTWQNR